MVSRLDVTKMTFGFVFGPIVVLSLFSRGTTAQKLVTMMTPASRLMEAVIDDTGNPIWAYV